MSSSGAKQEKYASGLALPVKQHLTSPRCGSQEASQIKEDLKNKQILKDLEAKRRGSSSRPVPDRYVVMIWFDFRKGGREEGTRGD
jgi:hypothetical protein